MFVFYLSLSFSLTRQCSPGKMLVNIAPGIRRLPHFTLILPSYLQKTIYTQVLPENILHFHWKRKRKDEMKMIVLKNERPMQRN
jgi:hypothetical protein